MPNDMESFQKELEADGLKLEGLSTEETPKEEPKEVPKELKETPQETPKEEPKETSNEIPKEENKNERTPREPKQIPAWKVEIERKRAEKAETNKTNELKEEFNKLKSEIEILKGHPKEQKSETDDAISKLADKYEVKEEFLKELFNILPKPKEETADEHLKRLETLEEERRIDRENQEYEQSFNSKVIPLLKAENPSIGEDEINSVKEAIKKDYFDEKFIRFDTDEIYRFNADKFSSIISAPNKQTAEKGTKGISRDSKVVDYDNITEEEYARLPDEEQEKVDQYKIKKSKGL